MRRRRLLHGPLRLPRVVLLAATVGITIAVWAALSGVPAVGRSSATADAGKSAAAEQVLHWLRRLPGRSANRVASGFFGGYSGQGFSLDETEELRNATGQFPAVLGCDYGAGWDTANDPTTLLDYSCNDALESWWSSGGLVTVSVHSPSPGNPDGGGLDTFLSDFADLTDPDTEIGARWQRYLDKIAAGLQDLQAAGVPVLFRPFHEMNGGFWWSNQDPDTFRVVWRQMYSYLTSTKELDNLIWVYAPDFGPGNPTAYYPGASYVDVVGLDVYSDDPANDVTGYDEMVALGKPFAFTEIGPKTPGSFDYAKWPSAIKERFPATTYFLAWNDPWAPHRNLNARALMNDLWVANRGEVDLCRKR